MTTAFRYATANESELNELVIGRAGARGLDWTQRAMAGRLRDGSVGVVWREPRHANDPVQPLVLVAQFEDHKRLFGRFAQLRSDLSPLSAWCHVLPPSRFESLDTLTREAELDGLEAAWTGLIVAEAALLTDRPIHRLKIASCLATQSFAIARAQALWGRRLPSADMLERYDKAQQLLKTGQSRATRLRPVLEPIWDALIAAFGSTNKVPTDWEMSHVVASIRALQQAKAKKDSNEALALVAPLSNLVPEAEALLNLPSLNPEERVHLFDLFIEHLDIARQSKQESYKHALALLAGYLATVAAGGAPSLSLAEARMSRWPEVMIWAYVLGGIGERVVWTSSFDGLGRLIARELMRPLRLDESPTCDFALDEAMVLVDPHLADPLVNLRIKQARVVIVSLMPGVNVCVSLDSDLMEGQTREGKVDRQRTEPTLSAATVDLMAALADAIWPHLRNRLRDDRAAERDDWVESSKYQKGRATRRGVPQAKLPLKGFSEKK